MSDLTTDIASAHRRDGEWCTCGYEVTPLTARGYGYALHVADMTEQAVFEHVTQNLNEAAETLARLSGSTMVDLRLTPRIARGEE